MSLGFCFRLRLERLNRVLLIAAKVHIDPETRETVNCSLRSNEKSHGRMNWYVICNRRHWVAAGVIRLHPLTDSRRLHASLCIIFTFTIFSPQETFSYSSSHPHNSSIPLYEYLFCLPSLLSPFLYLQPVSSGVTFLPPLLRSVSNPVTTSLPALSPPDIHLQWLIRPFHPTNTSSATLKPYSDCC